MLVNIRHFLTPTHKWKRDKKKKSYSVGMKKKIYQHSCKNANNDQKNNKKRKSTKFNISTTRKLNKFSKKNNFHALAKKKTSNFSFFLLFR